MAISTVGFAGVPLLIIPIMMIVYGIIKGLSVGIQLDILLIGAISPL